MFDRFTDSAREVVVHAQEESRSLDHDHIGTGHILLALLRGRDTVAARVLTSLHVSLDAVRQQVQAMTTASGSPQTHIPFTARGKKALELALREALGLRHNYIGSEHILLGIVREGEGTAVQVLGHLGVQPSDVRARAMELLAVGGDEPPFSEARERTIERGSGFSVQMGAVPTSGDDPRCARCNADVSQNLRARSIVLSPDAADGPPGSVTLLCCGTCGAVLGVLPAPPGS